jgi:hypothetical protein
VPRHELQRLALLSDDPIRDRERDGLGLAKQAEVVASAALGSEGPLTIGVFGSWGVGKTSVLHLARGFIEEQVSRTDVTTVLFNAWQYEQEEIPLVPLIASILQELEDGGAERKSRLVSALRAALYGLSVQLKGGVPSLAEVSLTFDTERSSRRFEALQAQWVEQQMERSLYHNALKALRQAQRSGQERHRVVIFIDDLDRCFPDRAVRLLESIKLVLSEPGFIFVLAVDRGVLDAYLDKRFSESFGLQEQERGQTYLAKFIQLPLWIPSHEERFDGLVNRLLEIPALAVYRKDLAPMSQEIALACGHNPRHLIRFLNDLLVERFLSSDRSDFSFRRFVADRGIRLHSELVYRKLWEDAKLRERLRELVRTYKTAEDLSPILLQERSKLGETNPSLADVLKRIATNVALAKVLVSQPAREWLENPGRRSLVKSFLEAPQLEQEKWDQTLTDQALEQIRSGDREQIVAGCLWLAQSKSPLRFQAGSQLLELATTSKDKSVIREAKRALAEIYSGFESPVVAGVK